MLEWSLRVDLVVFMSHNKANSLIHMFGACTLDADTAPRRIGEKGWGLHYMTELGLKVPAGFVITNEVSRYYLKNNRFPTNFTPKLKEYLKVVAESTSCNFGGTPPLLLAVRSGALVSAPGVMDTILNVGMTDEVYSYIQQKNPDFAYSCYKGFIIMFAQSVYEIDRACFKDVAGIAALKERFYELTGEQVPQDVYQQLLLAVQGVIKSSVSKKSFEYQTLEGLSNGLNTAIIVQRMVFGNRDEKSGSGVLFSRDPNSGEKKVFWRVYTGSPRRSFGFW